MQIEDTRERLNDLICGEGKLYSEGEILELSQQLDDLIIKYYEEGFSKI